MPRIFEPVVPDGRSGSTPPHKCEPGSHSTVHRIVLIGIGPVAAMINRLKITNNTTYSTTLLTKLVDFAAPEAWNRLQSGSDALYEIVFRESDVGLRQGEFNGVEIIINIPDLLDLPFYGNHTIEKARGPATLGGGYLPAKYQLAEEESMPVVNFTEWLLGVVAHEFHHAYLHRLNPQNYVNAMKPLSEAETKQEQDCERYAIKVVKKWRIEHGEKDLPFAELEGIEARIAEHNRRIEEGHDRFNKFLAGLTKKAPE